MMGSVIHPSVSSSEMYVVDCHNHQILKPTLMGPFCTTFGQKGVCLGQFDGLVFVIGDAHNRSIDFDWGNHTGFKHSLIMNTKLKEHCHNP